MAMALKRKKLTISEKVKIIQEVERNLTVSRVEIAKRFGLPPSSLSGIMLQKASILEEESRCGAHSKKRKNMKTSPNAEIEILLVEWFQQMRSENIPINGTLLREKATEIALRKKISTFKASNGWLDRFKKRHGISCKFVCGESGSVNEGTIEHWKESLPDLLEGYEPKNIFNADETGLFYNLLPNRTFSMKGEPCHGGKKSKQWLTVLLCCNSDGSEKLTPLVIGKYAKPRCFKNISSLPCKYVNNTKAWVTMRLFTDYLNAFDARMGCTGRKVIMFVDKCAAHPPNTCTSFLRNVKVVFFPANCTSMLQPLDLGIINCIKAKYKKALVQKTIAALERKQELKLNVLQALHLVAAAWSSVSSETIAHCFSKAGFGAINVNNNVDEEVIDEEDWKKISDNEAVTFTDFVNCDSNVITTALQSVEDLCTTESAENVGEESDEDPEAEQPLPTFGEAVAGFETMRRYLTSFPIDDGSMQRLVQVERELLFIRQQYKSRQTTLLDFFKK